MEKAHIFVANDDKAFLQLMQDILKDESYRVTLLHASKTAYEEIKAASPGLVILDIILEHPDAGWHVLQNLKLDPATTDIPIIVCSADARFMRDNEEKLRKHNCFTLNKPFDIDDLLAQVETALASRSQNNS